MALYSEKVMDHFTNPRNVGKIEDADGIGEVGNAKCGDIMTIYLKIENDVITDVKFNTFGCGSAGTDLHSRRRSAGRASRPQNARFGACGRGDTFGNQGLLRPQGNSLRQVAVSRTARRRRT